MKKLTTLLLLIFTAHIYAQTTPDRTKAEQSVMMYMSGKHKSYRALTFGECFAQYPSEALRKKAHAKKVISYSIVHTYIVGKDTTRDAYFHLDDGYHVIGINTDEEMSQLVQSQLEQNPKWDSITKSIEAQLKADTLFKDK